MTTLLKSGFEKIMRVFYQHKSETLHLRELSRRTHLHGQSITRYLDFLERNKFLLSKKEGNQRRYRLGHNEQIYSVFTLFDTERFEKLPFLRKQAITTYLQLLSQQPVYIILFGSTAKGNYTEQSDIDILIITPAKIDTKNAEKEVDALYAMKISTFQMRYQKFIKELKLREDKVVQSALNTGYPLINHIQYYEVLNNERV